MWYSKGKAQTMREIRSGQLWLGNARDGCDFERLFALGIAAVVNVAIEEPSCAIPRSMTYCRFPVLDGSQETEGILRVAIHTVASLLKNRIPTLVCCGAGMSRSPAISAAAISLVEGGDPTEQLQQLTEGQPHDISPRLWQTIEATLKNW
jgi:hypothetical protein